MSAADRFVSIYRDPDGLYAWEVRPKRTGWVTAQSVRSVRDWTAAVTQVCRTFDVIERIDWVGRGAFGLVVLRQGRLIDMTGSEAGFLQVSHDWPEES